MKAVLQRRYGLPDKVLQLADVPEPVPADDEVLVRVLATSVHPDIWHAVTGRPYILRFMGSGLFRPKNPIPGIDLAGVVESVGAAVTQFQPGDEVFGDVTRGTQWSNGGTFAELAAVPAASLALKPSNLDFVQAAAIPSSGVIAVQAIVDEGQVKPGHKVLVNGAGGGVGAFALQLAKGYGAQVTGVDHTKKLDMLRGIGADAVVDYTQQDPTDTTERYDLVVDVASTLSFKGAARILTPEGLYVLIGHDQFGENAGRFIGSIGRFLRMMLSSHLRGHLPKMNPSRDTSHRIGLLKDFAEAGKLVPTVDRTFPLGEVREAMRHLQHGRPLGKVVLTV